MFGLLLTNQKSFIVNNTDTDSSKTPEISFVISYTVCICATTVLHYTISVKSRVYNTSLVII